MAKRLVACASALALAVITAPDAPAQDDGEAKEAQTLAEPRIRRTIGEQEPAVVAGEGHMGNPGLEQGYVT